MPSLPEVSWTIDGKSVEVDDWSATCSLGGFGSMQGMILQKLPFATQGSVVTGYTPQRVMWEGRLVSPPHVRDGVAEIFAAGHKTRLEKENERLLFQSRDYSLWQGGLDAPHNFPGTDEFDAEARNSTLYFKVNMEAFTNGNGLPLAVWTPGAEITRYAFNIVKSRDSANFDIRAQRFTGPSGTRTLITDHDLSSGGSTSIDRNVTGAEDGLTLSIYCATTDTPGAVTIVRLNNLRINGIAAGDLYSCAGVLEEIGNRCGFDISGVSSMPTNSLPLDWVDDWASLADYVTMLGNGWWRVCEDRGNGPMLEAGSWDQSKEWFVSQAQGARLDLVPLELYNRVIVNYEGTNGAHRRVRVIADPNPLLSSGIINVYEESLDDRQPDDQLATSVAEYLIARYSVPRWAGSIEVSGPEAYEYRAGDKLTVTDWDMAESFTHKIVEVTYERDLVTISVEEDISAARIIANSQNREARRRRKRIR